MRQLPQPASSLCARWRKYLANGDINALPSDEQQALKAHLADCLTCTHVADGYQVMDALILNLPPVQPLPGLPARLALLMKEQSRGDIMYKDETTPGVETRVQITPEQRWKTLEEHVHRSSGRHKNSYWAHMRTSLAAVVVVAALISGVLLLFAYSHGVNSTTSTHTTHTSVAATIETPNTTVLYTNQETQNANIYAVDLHTGGVFWKIALPTKLTTSDLQAYHGLLFAPGYNGTLYALSTTNGGIVWSYQIPHPTFQVLSGTDIPNLPIASGNTVYFGAGSGFYAVNIQTGKLLWHLDPPTYCKEDPEGCTITISAVANNRVYAYSDSLHVLNAQTGQELWHNTGFNFVGPDSVVVIGDNVYVLSVNTGNLAILNASNGKDNIPDTIIGQKKVGGMGSLLAIDGIVYYSNGQSLIAIKGTQILWKRAYHISSLLAGSDQTLFVNSMRPLQQPNGTAGTYFSAIDTKSGAWQWYWGDTSGGTGDWGPGYPVSFADKLYFFNDTQQGGHTTPTLWVFHNNQRDLYPLKEQ